jgi:hypothetical protein
MTRIADYPEESTYAMVDLLVLDEPNCYDRRQMSPLMAEMLNDELRKLNVMWRWERCGNA